ncbi:MAG: hypothetical protein ACTHKQ_17770, partial [Mesorhizobium sp.]
AAARLSCFRLTRQIAAKKGSDGRARPACGYGVNDRDPDVSRSVDGCRFDRARTMDDAPGVATCCVTHGD